MAAFVVACGLILGEFLVRGLGLAPEVFPVRAGRYRLSSNPLIGYEMVPNYASGKAGPLYDFPERSNDLGFRDRNHPVAKPPGSYRILVLGDSIVQGLGIADPRQMFTAVLERSLRADGLSVEVLNFGVNGYNTRQEVETLRDKGLVYKPDLVIVAYCPNDDFLDSGGIRASLQRSAVDSPRPRLNPTLARSHLVKLAWAVYLDSRVRSAPVMEIPQDNSSELVPAALTDLREMSREYGFKVLVVGFPFLDRLAPGVESRLSNDLRRWSRDYGVPVLDLTGVMIAAADEGPIAVDLLHPNALGARHAGLAIADHIRSSILP